MISFSNNDEQDKLTVTFEQKWVNPIPFSHFFLLLQHTPIATAFIINDHTWFSDLELIVD